MSLSYDDDARILKSIWILSNKIPYFRENSMFIPISTIKNTILWIFPIVKKIDLYLHLFSSINNVINNGLFVKKS